VSGLPINCRAGKEETEIKKQNVWDLKNSLRERQNDDVEVGSMKFRKLIKIDV
jgi:hypothetical protein